MTRKLDELGRIVLPVEMRSKLHLEKEDAVNIDCVDDKIIFYSHLIMNYFLVFK